MPDQVQGRFITLEGGEGTGKSTQVGLLVDRLRECGVRVVATREPGGSDGAEAIRRLLVDGDVGRWTPMTEALLLFAARKEHLERTILPALKQGKWVVSDRFADSTMAYQGHAHGLGTDVISDLYNIVVGPFRPDFTIILDLPATVGLARAGRRVETGDGPAEDRFERMGLAFHERLREGLLDIARNEPQRCAIVDAAGDVDSVAAAVWAKVARHFGL
ncbi:MAG: dTMP kinase [Sphingomonadales bacterium]